MLIDFDEIINPEEKWGSTKLSDKNPCVHCEVTREYRKFADETIICKCNMCMKYIAWKVDCFQKLKWYEDNDERLKSKDNEV
jgi:hypothetical protein